MNRPWGPYVKHLQLRDMLAIVVMLKTPTIAMPASVVTAEQGNEYYARWVYAQVDALMKARDAS